MSVDIRLSRQSVPEVVPPTVGLAVPPPTAGVLAGVSRTDYIGSNRFESAGQTISHVNMNFGQQIYILASNVTFYNVNINGAAFSDRWRLSVDSRLPLDHCTMTGNRDNSTPF